MESNSWIILAGVFLLAILVGSMFRRLGQLNLVGYILVGFLCNYGFSHFNIEWPKEWNELASIGGVLLLFLIGLEMKVSEVSSIGKVLLLIFIIQVGLLGSAIYPLMRLLSLSRETSLIMGISLAFSSTILVVKILSEKKMLNSLTGRLSVGLLILQDLLSIFLMTVLSNGSLTVLTRGGLVAMVLVLVGNKFVLGAFKLFVRSTEEVVMFSLGWCLVIASFFASKWIGLSPEIGGFVAGLTLSSTFENHHIVSKVKTLRDFFIVIFFLSLGFQIKLAAFTVLGGVGLGLLLLLIKFLTTVVLIRLLGFANRVAFDAALGLASASEFTLILMSSIEMSSEVRAVLVMSVITSMVLSAFVLGKSDRVFQIFGKSFSFWHITNGGSTSGAEGSIWPQTRFVLLIGGHRMGKSVLSALESQDREVVVVDYDPEVISGLKAEGIRAYFADVSDVETLNNIPFGRIDLVISTIPNSFDNLGLIRYLNKGKYKIKVVVDAEDFQDATDLYKAGVDYVVFPHFVGGLHLAEILSDQSSGTLEKYKNKQTKMLARVFKTG